MSVSSIRTLALAAALSLTAGGAFAQTAAERLGYTAAPATAEAYGAPTALRVERPLTVMGMTGGIEPKYPETTGSIVVIPSEPRYGRLR